MLLPVAGYLLTVAVGSAKGNDSGGIRGIGTGLVGAVTYTIAETRLSAVAGDIARGTAKLRLSDLEHVANTCLL